MKRALCCAILLPLIALAGGKADLMKVQTVANDGQYVGNTAPVYAAPPVVPRGSTTGTDFAGRIDTVGGTTYDWQNSGPEDQVIVVDSNYGVHVIWMRSSQLSGHSDRNIGYNFYDFATHHWNYVDTFNFMNSGCNVFTIRSGFGNLDVNPVTGVACIGCHQTGNPINPTVAKDAAPGAGIFTECSGTPNADGYLWPSISLTPSEKIHAALCDNATLGTMSYSAVNPWCNWSAPIPIATPDYPSYICRASKRNPDGKVLLTWVNTSAYPAESAGYCLSTDDGTTWGQPVTIPPPPAFHPGSDTVSSFSPTGVNPLWDHADSLHLVATVIPFRGDTGYFMPAEIWHWYEPSGVWSRVTRAGCDSAHLAGSIGYDAMYADRPTLGLGRAHDLVCAWEEFDSTDVEPLTGMLRAEIRAARSVDNGLTWDSAMTLTDRDSTSKRFPCVAQESYQDTFWVRYLDDLVAGFGIAPYAQGPVTYNPILVQRVDWHELPGAVMETRPQVPAVPALAAFPNPFMRSTTVSYELPKSGNVRLSVCDATGRTVRVLVNETKGPGRYSADWDGRDKQGRTLPAGIYFCALEAEGRRLSRKLVLLP